MKTTRHNLCQMMTLLSLVVLLSLIVAQAQTYTVIHNFSGGTDGAQPYSGLTPDGAGNYYGTTFLGGNNHSCTQYGCGTVYRLSKKNGAWVLTNLYTFEGGADGGLPKARVVFGPDGALYGTTFGGGSGICGGTGCGIVFRLTPPASPCHAVSCPWTETTLHAFNLDDGAAPGAGDLVFDHSGNIYGTTTRGGGNPAWGVVYKLTHVNGQWTETVLFNFDGYDQGGTPQGGVIFDNDGNLWGTTQFGGLNNLPEFWGPGVIYELTPNGTGWTAQTIHEFRNDTSDGGLPQASLFLANDGSMYGTSSTGGAGLCAMDTYYTGCGSVFALFPGGYAPLFLGFTSGSENPSLSGPTAPVTVDSNRNVYGTAWGAGEFGAGSIFKLTFGSYTYSSLHDFTGESDGGNPSSNVVIDSNGHLLGTAVGSGGSPLCRVQGGCGVIWEITQ